MSSVAAKPTKALSFMENLDPLVAVSRPETSSPTSTDAAARQPRLIIIAGWTDARDSHVAKYIVKYQALYPNAEILLLRSTMKQIMRPTLIGPAMKHAATVVHSAFPTKSSASNSPAGLLIHMFSNGGSSSIANLYQQYAATAGPGDDKSLPPHVTILDSCPGVYGISHAVAVVSVGLSSVQRLIAAPLLYTFATIWSFGMSLGLIPDSIGDWGKAHNNDVGNTNETHRVYIYSPSDKLIDYKVVEAHAAEAKAKGFSVELEKYEGSAHVAHLRKDEDRYWQIVRQIVEGL